MALLTLYGNTLTLYSSPLALYAGAVTTAPIQSGWGTYDTREDERRQARVDQAKRDSDRRRRKAIEQAFRALDVQPEAVPEFMAPQVKAEIRAVALPKISLAGVDLALDRAAGLLDALIEAMWAERQAEAIRAAQAKWLMQEEEALIALLMVA
jgi:hypothetical protein